jgi:hypothetical protein
MHIANIAVAIMSSALSSRSAWFEQEQMQLGINIKHFGKVFITCTYHMQMYEALAPAWVKLLLSQTRHLLLTAQLLVGLSSMHVLDLTKLRCSTALQDTGGECGLRGCCAEMDNINPNTLLSNHIVLMSEYNV